MASVHVKPNGAYIVRWRVDGKQHAKQFNDRAAAEAFKAERDSEALSRDVLKNTPGFPGWDDKGPMVFEAIDATYALENYMRALVNGNRNLRQTTREMYERNIRVHIEGTALGKADIRAITAEALNAYWAELPQDRRGVQGNVARLLSLTFKHAMRTGLIEANPLDRAPHVRKPSPHGRRQVRPLTVQEAERLADCAATPRDRMEILVMVYGGLRAGEVGGLRVEDVDWEASRLHVRHSVARLSTGLEVGDVKTSAARRVVALPQSVTDDLGTFLDENPPADDGRVFHGWNDSLRDHIRINRSVQTAARRAGVKTHAHALRHTAVSLWVTNGASPVDVQHMVGHTNVETTLGQYAHLFTYGGDALAATMEALRDAHRNGARRPQERGHEPHEDASAS